jgi:predicted O-methyltransferase YrrM
MNTTALSEAIRRRRQLAGLPPAVAVFFARARRLAVRQGDYWSLASATGPRSLAHVLREARGHRHVVEIGTGTGWTTVACALADTARQVVSYDPVVRPERSGYLALTTARERIELLNMAGERGPRGGERTGFVFVDGSHERDRTIATFEAWHRAVEPGGAIAFHDWHNDRYPGVTEAIIALGLRGEAFGDVFVWRPPRRFLR